MLIAAGIYQNLKPNVFTFYFALLYFVSSISIARLLESGLYRVESGFLSIVLTCLLRPKLTPLILITASVYILSGAILNFNPSLFIALVCAIYYIRDTNEE